MNYGESALLAIGIYSTAFILVFLIRRRRLRQVQAQRVKRGVSMEVEA